MIWYPSKQPGLPRLADTQRYLKSDFRRTAFWAVLRCHMKAVGGKAKEVAQAKAKELKYELQYESMYFDDDDPASEE